MATLKTRTLFITKADKARLENWLALARGLHPKDQHYTDLLEQEIERAEVIAPTEIPPDVITMHSSARVRDLRSGKVDTYTLVFPDEADFSRKRISVLAPIGRALLGSQEGEIIEWNAPAGVRRMKVESALYQPEAAGHDFDSAATRNQVEMYRAA